MTDWLSDTLLATSALLLLVLLIRTPVARHFGAGTAYFLWALPAARLFMPSLTHEVAAPAAVERGIVDGVRDATLAALATGRPAIAEAQAGWDWGAIALSIWLGGATLLFIVQMYRYVALREELLSDAVEIDRIGTIRIIQTDRICGPLAFGLLRRYVAVPRDFTHTFSPRERELALAHELAHHRGGDLFANMAGFITLCLLWFNPLAWFAWTAFRFDQEAACDARVVAGADARTRQTYGRALARTATEGLPAFAMALNSPRTIIQRLRRLMMTETSRGRRIAGKLAILGMAAVALPLTATVVPVFAEDPPAEPVAAPAPEARKHKVLIVKAMDGKPAEIDIAGDAETPFVKTLNKDGKTIVLRSTKELSEAEIDKMVAEAEASRAKAEAMVADGERDEKAHRRIVVRKVHGDAGGPAFALADPDGTNVVIDAKQIAAMIPDIEIRELRGKCDAANPVVSDVHGIDATGKSRIRIALCGKGQANMARLHAIEGLKEARDELKQEADMPDNVRKDVIENLDRQIEKLEKQIKSDPDASGDA